MLIQLEELDWLVNGGLLWGKSSGRSDGDQYQYGKCVVEWQWGFLCFYLGSVGPEKKGDGREIRKELWSKFQMANGVVEYEVHYNENFMVFTWSRSREVFVVSCNNISILDDDWWLIGLWWTATIFCIDCVLINVLMGFKDGDGVQ